MDIDFLSEELVDKIRAVFGDIAGDKNALFVSVTNRRTKENIKSLIKGHTNYLLVEQQKKPLLNSYNLWWNKGSPPYKGDNRQPLAILKCEDKLLKDIIFPVPAEHRSGLWKFVSDIEKGIEEIKKEECKKELDALKSSIFKKIKGRVSLDDYNRDLHVSLTEEYNEKFLNFFQKYGNGYGPGWGAPLFKDSKEYQVFVSEDIEIMCGDKCVMFYICGGMMFKNYRDNIGFINKFFEEIF